MKNKLLTQIKAKSVPGHLPEPFGLYIIYINKYQNNFPKLP